MTMEWAIALFSGSLVLTGIIYKFVRQRFDQVVYMEIDNMKQSIKEHAEKATKEREDVEKRLLYIERHKADKK